MRRKCGAKVPGKVPAAGVAGERSRQEIEIKIIKSVLGSVFKGSWASRTKNAFKKYCLSLKTLNK